MFDSLWLCPCLSYHKTAHSKLCSCGATNGQTASQPIRRPEWPGEQKSWLLVGFPVMNNRRPWVLSLITELSAPDARGSHLLHLPEIELITQACICDNYFTSKFWICSGQATLAVATEKARSQLVAKRSSSRFLRLSLTLLAGIVLPGRSQVRVSKG